MSGKHDLSSDSQNGEFEFVTCPSKGLKIVKILFEEYVETL